MVGFFNTKTLTLTEIYHYRPRLENETLLKEFAKDGTLKTASKQEGNGKGRVKFLSYVRIYTFCIIVK